METAKKQQPQWNIYEAVILLDAYIETQKKERPKSHIIKSVSVALRQMAVNQGVLIDDVFRNENGISYQLQSMESAYKGVKVYVPATKLFTETVSIYNENRKHFDSLLEEARRMVANTKNVQIQFCEWLQKNAPRLRPDAVCQMLAVGEAFCKKINVLSAPLFETTDVDIIKKYVRTITNNKIFRIRNKKQYPAIVNAVNLYCTYIRTLSKSLPLSQDVEIEQASHTESSIPNNYTKRESNTSETFTADAAPEIMKDNVADSSWIQLSNGNYQQFQGTRPAYCEAGGCRHKGKNWIQVLTAIANHEIESGNQKISDLYQKPLFPKQNMRPFFTKEKVEDRNCSQLENGYWINVHYGIPRLVQMLYQFCVHCGYEDGQIKIYGVSKDGTEGTRKSFDIQEAAILLDEYLSGKKAGKRNSEIAELASKKLRLLAQARGNAISPSFRSPIGLQDRLRALEGLYENREIPSSPGTKVFREIIELHRKDRGKFKEIVRDAQSSIESNSGKSANEDEIKTTDLSVERSYAFTTPISFSYFGDETIITSWRELYIKCIAVLLNDYPSVIKGILGTSILGGRIDIGDVSSAAVMASQKKVSDDIFVETNYSATDLMKRLRRLIDLCNVDYENVGISYRTNPLSDDVSTKDKPKTTTPQHDAEKPGQAHPPVRNPERTADRHFDSELIEAVEIIIPEAFPNGLRKYSQIARKKFSAKFKELVGYDFPETIDLDELALTVGIEHEDKIYAPSKETKKLISDEISKAKENGCHFVFYEEFYNAFSNQLSSDSIFSAELFRKVLEHIMPDMIFRKAYACFSKEDSLANDIIRAYGDNTFLSYNEIKRRLPYVNLYQIRLTCSKNEKFVSMGDEVYALSDLIKICENDVEKARNNIKRDIERNGFATLNRINVEESESLNHGIHSSALQTILFDRYLSGTYSRKRKLITQTGVKLNVYDVIKEYCLEFEKISMEEIEAYEREVSGNFIYGLRAAFDSMVRVDKDTFVHRDFIEFDVEATDRALALYVKNSICPIADIASFTSFPYVEGYSWNVFLLDSFCAHYSKKYRSIGGPAQRDIVGAIYPIEMQISSYSDLLSQIAADSGLKLTDDIIVSYFSQHRLLLKKRNMNEVLAKAQEIRLREE